MTMPADLAALRALLDAATPGPWETDSEKTDEGHLTYVMYEPGGARLFDALNSSAVLVQYDYSDDGAHEWDETARRNFALIAALVNAAPGLLAEVERGRAAVEVLEAEAAERAAKKEYDQLYNGRLRSPEKLAPQRDAARAWVAACRAADAARARYRALKEAKDGDD